MTKKVEDVNITTNEPPPETDDEAIERLAGLSPMDYGRIRKAEAKRLGISRVNILNNAVAAARGGNAKPGQGRALNFSRAEPWSRSVNGAVLLNDLTKFFTRYVFLPSGAADAMAVWVVHTYCYHLFRHSPRLALRSPDPRCGKTTALDALGLVVATALPADNITTAATFRVIEEGHPTLLIDEVDTFLSRNDEMRGVLNAGHKRGGAVLRCVGDDNELRAFDVYSPVALAGIGKLGRLGTIEDRAIMVQMKRATRDERPARLDDEAREKAAELASRCARWANDHQDRLTNVEPGMPADMFNRVADNWRPMFTIAEAAGGDWPRRIAAAAAGLIRDYDDESLSTHLLSDIRDIFVNENLKSLPSGELARKLRMIDSSPWPEINRGQSLTTYVLARRLKPYGIAPTYHWVGPGKNDSKRGYKRDDFVEAWRRYLTDQPAEDSVYPRVTPKETARSLGMADIGRKTDSPTARYSAVSSPSSGSTRGGALNTDNKVTNIADAKVARAKRARGAPKPL